jgi:hypothetical protein
MNILRYTRVEHESTCEPPTGRTSSRGLIFAMSLCGALTGGSIVEAIAAFASRSGTPISPTHLIAEPLAFAGAVCGGLLAAVFVTRGVGDSTEPFAPAETCPTEPALWQPAPYIAMPQRHTSLAMSAADNAPEHPRRATRPYHPRRAQTPHRAMRREAYNYRIVRAALPHQLRVMNTRGEPGINGAAATE